ncbi:barstar family protein [Microbacterium sp.]|uniref:barstar family protein n=1 Tax=Microbacterium sp. TaxID=51671 RepID=UPI003A8EE889
MTEIHDTHALSNATLARFEGSESEVVRAASDWRRDGFTVRTLRGRKMRELHSLFDEFSAALQFPYYFGENWAAFQECISDMEWLPPAAGYVLLITNAEEVLADGSELDLQIFWRTLQDAASTYALPVDDGESWDRGPVSFRVVLQMRDSRSE